MSKYTTRDSALDLRGLSFGIKSPGVEVKVDSDGKKVAVRSSEELAEIARGFTLDDLGGRSDALGG